MTEVKLFDPTTGRAIVLAQIAADAPPAEVLATPDPGQAVQVRTGLPEPDAAPVEDPDVAPPVEG